MQCRLTSTIPNISRMFEDDGHKNINPFRCSVHIYLNKPGKVKLGSLGMGMLKWLYSTTAMWPKVQRITWVEKMRFQYFGELIIVLFACALLVNLVHQEIILLIRCSSEFRLLSILDHFFTFLICGIINSQMPLLISRSYGKSLFLMGEPASESFVTNMPFP